MKHILTFESYKNAQLSKTLNISSSTTEADCLQSLDEAVKKFVITPENKKFVDKFTKILGVEPEKEYYIENTVIYLIDPYRVVIWSRETLEKLFKVGMTHISTDGFKATLYFKP